MKKYQFDPAQAVGSSILEYDRETLCRFIIKLCERVKADAGAGVYRISLMTELSQVFILAVGSSEYFAI